MFHLKVRHEKRSMSFIGATFFGWRDPTLLQIMQICAVILKRNPSKGSRNATGTWTWVCTSEVWNPTVCTIFPVSKYNTVARKFVKTHPTSNGWKEIFNDSASFRAPSGILFHIKFWSKEQRPGSKEMVLGKGIFGADIDLGMRWNQPFLSFNILFSLKNSKKKRKGPKRKVLQLIINLSLFKFQGQKWQPMRSKGNNNMKLVQSEPSALHLRFQLLRVVHCL